MNYESMDNILCKKRYSPSGNNLRLNEKADPGGHNEHKRWKINLNQELHLFSLQSHLDSTGSISTFNINMIN